MVSLDALAQDEFSSFEFGKGFDYRTHLTIGMTDLGKTLSQYLVSCQLSQVPQESSWKAAVCAINLNT